MDVFNRWEIHRQTHIIVKSIDELTRDMLEIKIKTMHKYVYNLE